MSFPVRTDLVQPAVITNVSFTKRLGNYLSVILLVAVDYCMIVLALLSAYHVRNALVDAWLPILQLFDISFSALYFLFPIVFLTLFAYEHMYFRRLPFWQSVSSIFKICTYAIIITAAISYFIAQNHELPRLFLVFSWLFAVLYLSVARYYAKRILSRLGLWRKPIIIVGAGKTAELLAQAFDEDPGMGYQIVGLIEDYRLSSPLSNKHNIIGNFASMQDVIVRSGVQDVVIAAPGLAREKLIDVVGQIQPYVKNLSLVPDLFGVPMSNMEVETLFNQKALMLRMQNNLACWYNRLFKKLFDLVIGSIAAIIFLPFIIAISAAIYVDSKGPIFHNGARIGRKGNAFHCYKFRTMFVNNNQMLQEYLASNSDAKTEWQRYQKLKEYDPRVTRVGKILRRYSLDELPQIFNVLKGEMSLVGPRPYLPREKLRMSYWADTILETTPGITGLWQVNGRNEIDFEGRMSLEAWYVKNWSLWLDIVCILKTIKVVLDKKGAY